MCGELFIFYNINTLGCITCIYVKV